MADATAHVPSTLRTERRAAAAAARGAASHYSPRRHLAVTRRPTTVATLTGPGRTGPGPGACHRHQSLLSPRRRFWVVETAAFFNLNRISLRPAPATASSRVLRACALNSCAGGTCLRSRTARLLAMRPTAKKHTHRDAGSPIVACGVLRIFV